MHNFSVSAEKDLDDLDHDLPEVCKDYKVEDDETRA